MNFEKGNLYHVFNRGNNSQIIFFRHENYLFFLKKISDYIIPYADIIAWCLMPTHFHLLIEVINESIEIQNTSEATDDQFQGNHLNKTRMRTLNDSLGILLRSYARAIQKQEKSTGSLFQKNTKAICLSDAEFLPAWFNSFGGTIINIPDGEKDHPIVCFNYIHNNPVKVNLVKNPEDWEFSSFMDYYSGRGGKLVNIDKSRKFGFI